MVVSYCRIDSCSEAAIRDGAFPGSGLPSGAELFEEGSMNVQIICPECGKQHSVREERVGLNFHCSSCGESFEASPSPPKSARPKTEVNDSLPAYNNYLAEPSNSARPKKGVRPGGRTPASAPPVNRLWEILKRHPILLISFWVMIGTIVIGALATVGSIWTSGHNRVDYLLKTGLATGTLFLAALLTMGIGRVYVGDGRTGLLNSHLLYTVCFTLLIVCVVLGTFFVFVIIWGDAPKVSFQGVLSVVVIALASVLTTIAGFVYLGKGSGIRPDQHVIHLVNFAVVVLCIVGGMLFSIVAIWSEKPDIAFQGDLSAVVVFVTTMLISMIVKSFLVKTDAAPGTHHSQDDSET
jgi:predicted RNA-binding Zn-ribbon protein involved in translation (DUF1610 family)